MIDVKFYKFLYNLAENEDVNLHWNKIGKDNDYYPNIEKFYENFPDFDFTKYSDEKLKAIKLFLDKHGNNLFYQKYFDKFFFNYIQNYSIEKIIEVYNKNKSNCSICIDYDDNNLTFKKIIKEIKDLYKFIKVFKISDINDLNECTLFINLKKNISKHFFNYCYENNILYFSYDFEKNIKIKKTGYPYFFKNKSQLFKLIDIYLSNKTFDIVVPCYNCEDYILNTLKSLLSQVYKKFNIYLINDNSYDNTLKIINKYSNYNNINIINNSINYGKYVSINKIIPNLKGDYVLIVDSDDLIIKNRLFNDLVAFSLEPNIQVVQSKYYRYDEENYQIIQKPSFGENIITFSRQIFSNIGLFYPTKFGGDTEFIERILKFLGEKYIKQYNRITYISIIRKDKKNLTKKVTLEKRLEFIRKYRQLHENNNIDFFLKLFK